MSHNTKKQITLRGIPKEVWKEIETEADRHKTSVNKVLLKRITPQQQTKREGCCAPLLAFAGSWDEKRAADFENQFSGHRQIDPELWS
ncbi:MAG: hypothetical protein HYY44_04675 [Deltaproteobacteria bacterium]|nr:hypothetical protein [Deltaproteobacteria bacterium]